MTITIVMDGRSLRSDRVFALSALAAVTLICWAWIAPMAIDMYGPMSGASAWMMTARWDTAHTALLWAMWAVMMAAMMLPSASPIVVTYAALLRRSSDPSSRVWLPVGALTAGYLLAWALFSVAATILQRAFTGWLLTPMMEAAGPRVAGALLLVAGLFQLTPVKRACLGACRSPLSFLMQHWRRGLVGALRLGFDHGLYCLGCCWALMLLLFAGGVMNLYVIAALTAAVVVEKLAPFGMQTSRALGVVLLALGVWFVMK